MADPTKNAINAVIAELEEQLEFIKRRVQRFKNTVDPKLMQADEAIQSGIKDFNDYMADFTKRVNGHADEAKKAIKATQDAKAAAQKKAAEADAKAERDAEKAAKAAKEAPKEQASAKYAREAAKYPGTSDKRKAGDK